MTTDENILEEMLERATNPAKDTDELSIQMFCIVVKSNQSLLYKAQELIVNKIRSYNTSIATKAIALLEECMSKCGSEFQDECAKFRFLNELIRLVSKKYQGSETPKEIKQRIMECLLLWTTEFPKKTKIREAYEMLCKEGAMEKNEGFSSAAAKRESVLGIDEEMLAKLIKSGDPENLKRANLLIKYRVSQEARRTELIMQHKSELQEVQTTIALLNEMLDKYSESDLDVLETIKELYRNCKKHKPLLKRMPELLESTNTELIADTIEANDTLLAVMARYKNVTQSLTKTTLPVSGPKVNTCNADLLTELLNNTIASTPKDPIISPSNSKQQNTSESLQELSDIFKIPASADTSDSTIKSTSHLFDFSNCLQPAKLDDNIKEDKSEDKTLKSEFEKSVSRGFAELSEIDRLSEDLLKQSLATNEIVGNFNKETKKPTLNDLAKEKSLMDLSPTKETNREKTTNVTKTDLPLDFEETSDKILEEDIKEGCQIADKIENELPVKHLSDITIDLDDIKPTGYERLLLDDNDLQLKIIFTENRPSKNVSVIVITASNKSNLHINDFHIEASAKKACKVRLLPATDSCMLPNKPFRSSTPINQILLLFNTTGKNVDLTFLLGYKLGDDPDPIKDAIISKDIPYVE